MEINKIIIGCILLACISGFFAYTNTTTADQVGRERYNDLKYTYFYSLTGSAPYVRFINKDQGKVYDDTATTTDYLSNTTTWTDTDVSLTTKMTSIGGWLVPVPSTLPDGTYDMLLYDVDTAAGSRSNSDAIARGKHIRIRSGQIEILADI